MYLAVLETAGDHFARLVTVPPSGNRAGSIEAALQTSATSTPDADLVARDGATLEAIRMAGNGIAPVQEALGLFDRARTRISKEIAAVTCDDPDEIDSALTDDCRAVDVDVDVALDRPAIGFTAWLERDVAAE